MSTTDDLREDWFECPCCGVPAFAPSPATHVDGTASPCGCPTSWKVYEEDDCGVAWDEDEQCMTCTRREWCGGPDSEAGRAFRGEGSPVLTASRAREHALQGEVERLRGERGLGRVLREGRKAHPIEPYDTEVIFPDPDDKAWPLEKYYL